MGPLSPLEPFAPRHKISQFSSGVLTLDAWLRGKARLNETRVGRNMLDPVILLGQLAVDDAYRGRRLGSDLLIDAARRAMAAAGMVGARDVIVQAIDEQARAFYEKFGFRLFSDREPLMLVLRMSEIEGLLQT